jgi:hypothetical protein
MLRFALLSFLVACAVSEEGVDPADYDVSDDDMAADQAFDSALAAGKADGDLTYVAVARVAKAAGLSCSGDRIAVATAVAKAESQFDPRATNVVGNSHGTDRGLWQVNSYYHPEVSATCAFSPSCNARAMAHISSYGTNFRPWWTYVNGKHLPYMASARNAQAAVCP